MQLIPIPLEFALGYEDLVHPIDNLRQYQEKSRFISKHVIDVVTKTSESMNTRRLR